MNDALCCFIHIPKCAGISLSRALVGIYGPQHVLRYDVVLPFSHFWRCYNHWSSPELRAFVGHMPYGYHRIDPRTSYCTLLRHPYERTISDYEHIKRDSMRVGHKEARLGFAALIRSKVYPWVDNAMVRFLSGSDAPVGELGEQHLELAKRNIDCVNVGFVDDLPEAMHRFAEVFGWRQRVPVLDRHNARAEGAVPMARLTDEDQALVQSVNELDVQLYKYARDEQ